MTATNDLKCGYSERNEVIWKNESLLDVKMINEFKTKSMSKTLKYTNVFYSFKQKDTVKQKYAYFAISDKKYKTKSVKQHDFY